MKRFTHRVRRTLPGAWGAYLVLVVICTAPAGANLVVNGDFQDGNKDFRTDFTYSPGDITPEYTYDVVSDPFLVHPNATSYYDHTFGTVEGLMMAVNGIAEAGVPNMIWGQMVDVLPNLTYIFTCWHSLWEPGPAGLQVFVNGIPLGPEFMAGDELGEWIVYEVSWKSADATEARIEIVNTTVSVGWNDFSLDDIRFAPAVPLERDTWAGIKVIRE